MGTLISTRPALNPAGGLSWLKKPRYLSLGLAAAALAAYLVVLRPRLLPATASPIELIAIGVLLLALVVSGAIVVVTGLAAGVVAARTRAKQRVRPWLLRMRGAAISILACVLVLTGLVLASQWMAYTAPILGEDGRPLPNSIASLEKVRLGGVDQWLIVRGHDVNKPVLLFLSGGPGGSEAGRVLRFNRELEKHCVDFLQTPSKRLDFFEDSGHGMIWQEPDKFHDLMIHTVLPETYRP